jgi:membrane protein YdbS with pleckstrin-like domain
LDSLAVPRVVSTDSTDDPRHRTTVPLVSRALAFSLALSSLPVLAVIAALTWVENDPWWVVAVAAVVLWGPVPLVTRLRFSVEVDTDELRYRVRPWHRRPRVVPLDSIQAVERRFDRPESRLTLRRINLGRDWIDWTDDEVRYVLGDAGVRIVREDGPALCLWLDDPDELVRAMDGGGTPAGRLR